MEFPLPQLSLPPRKNSYHTLISYPTGNYTEQSNNWINPSPVSIQTEINLTSEESFAISKKLEGYAARPHLRAPSIDHDEQIIVDDDDSLPFGDYVTHSGNGIKAIYTRGNQNVIVRSPSPVAVRPPIRRDRSEIGRKQRCLVCDTVTSGFHFGAVSCAACSAFFRRTIAERREYTCRAEGSAHLKCEISAEQRCYCRACRLQKCIDVGMDPMAVQPHRDQIGAKRKHDGQRHSMESPVPSADGSLYLNPRIEEVLSGRLARSIGGSPPLKRGKATTALLASNTSYAEQLIALSRQPVISERKAATLTTRHAQSSSPTVSEENDNVVQRESADSDAKKPPTLEEKLPSVNNESNDEGKFIVYEYEIYSGDEGSAESGSKPRSWPSEGKHRISLMPQDKNETDTSNLPDPSENVIETLVSAYERLRERRRLLYCPDTIRDILGGNQPVSRPADCGARMQKQRLRQEVGLVAEFLSVLTPFTNLDLDDKIALFKALSCPYSILEKHYVTMRGGGLQQNRIIHNDNSYTDLTDAALDRLQLEGGKADHPFTDKAMLKRVFIDPLRDSLQEVTGAMYNMKMTDVEFCALIAVILFDPSTAGLSDATRAHVRAARERIYEDWFLYYRSRNVLDSSQRVGNTMLLLPAVQATAEKSHENYHMVRVFDLFAYDKILDEIMLQA